MRRELSERALEYVSQRLWLARGLEGPLREAMASGHWIAWTMAPPEVPQKRLEELSRGGGISSIGMKEALLGEVAKMIATADPATVWIVPDPMAQPGDPVLSRVKVPHMNVDEAVYYITRDSGPSSVMAAWLAASSAVGEMGLVTTWAHPACATQADLVDAGHGANVLVMEAYDGEGVLSLSRSN